MTEAERPSVLLLSSNLRRRYAEDILTALSLPPGALLQFRYDAEYVAPHLQASIADGSVIGQRALIAFVADVEDPEPLLVPVRMASVVLAENIADMIVLRLCVSDYANLEDQPLAANELKAASKAWLDKLREKNGGRYFPAVTKFPDFRIHESSDRAQQWLGIARRLSLHNTFANSYFVRVDDPLLVTGKKLSFDEQGRLSLSDRQSGKLQVSFYSQKYSDDVPRTLSCATDGTFLRISSDDTYDVALRYDSVEFWLQPSTTSFDSLARVTIRLGGPAEESTTTGSRALTTNVRFPVVVRRSRSRLLIRVTSSAIGALLVALPAILGQNSSLRLRILSAVIGAGLIAYATIVVARGDR
jgi:hypothetical protein